MFETNKVASYLTRITQIRDDLVTVEETINSEELVRLALGGFPSKWDVFGDGIIARENMPSWDRLSNHFIQEETKRCSKIVGQYDV